jgi:hypothetical protein
MAAMLILRGAIADRAAAEKSIEDELKYRNGRARRASIITYRNI